ncbi:extracellular solute-binding protein [Streptomyces sp. FIT100]|nr:extracellular solute-binding protein [Streptomyces sp. FIT100]
MRGRRERVRMRRGGALGVAVTVVSALLAACSGGMSVGGGSPSLADANSKYGFRTAPQDAGGAITVWVDSSRLPAAKAFEKAHPDVKVKIVSYDGGANGSNTFKTKSHLYDRAGSGWPDVAFTTDNNAASWGSLSGTGALAPLNKGLVPSSTLDGFATGALAPCTVDGTAYCLRNDLAQNVLWYNKSLMDKWGYEVPTTWEQYEQLADRVAAEHPGYIVGTAGDAWTPEIYMWGSQCPANQVTAAKSVTVNTSDPTCLRAAKLIDRLIANRTMSTLPLFGPEFAKEQGGKVLMLPGPSWYGGSVFQGALRTPGGQITVGAPLHWRDQNPPVTGSVGGGAWWISSHSKNLTAAVRFATWVTTHASFDGKPAPTYPAHSAAATQWLSAQQAGGYYAQDIAPPLVAAAGQVWPGWGSAEFSQEALWAKSVQAGMVRGESVESLLPAWQKAIEQEAQVLGYRVRTP